MESPNNAIWGPQLWIILHSSAERIGSQHLKRLPQEESRIWGGLLSSLRYSLPCPLCKKHFTEYGASHPLHTITKEAVRTWLFQLHSEINTKLQRTNAITLEDISELYGKPFHFSKHCKVVEQHMGYAVRIGWSSRNDNIRTLRFLEELKRFYDFF
jgi:hypothetical protein